MRDGRIVCDGAPLLDHEVHQPWLGSGTHHPRVPHSDHALISLRPRSSRRGEPLNPAELADLFAKPFMQRALIAAPDRSRRARRRHLPRAAPIWP